MGGGFVLRVAMITLMFLIHMEAFGQSNRLDREEVDLDIPDPEEGIKRTSLAVEGAVGSIWDFPDPSKIRDSRSYDDASYAYLDGSFKFYDDKNTDGRASISYVDERYEIDRFKNFSLLTLAVPMAYYFDVNRVRLSPVYLTERNDKRETLRGYGGSVDLSNLMVGGLLFAALDYTK